MNYTGAIAVLVEEYPWVRTENCEYLLERAALDHMKEIPEQSLDLFLNEEGIFLLRLLHSHEADRGLAGI